MKHPAHSQQGFAAIAAIFLVVILAALGAFMVSISSTQQITSAQDVQGTRAYWAARAGLEWGISGLTAASAAPAGTLSVDGFTVVVTSSKLTFNEGASPVTVFQLQSVASAGTVGSVGRVERSVSASVEK